MTDLELTGARATQAALEQFPKKFANKAVRQVLRDVMKTIVLPWYKAHAPVGLTGKLKRGAKVRTAKNRRGGRLPRGTIGIAVRVFNVRYASFRLLGTKHMQGSATLRKAMSENEQRIKTVVETRLRQKVPQIAAEVRRTTKSLG